MNVSTELRAEITEFLKQDIDDLFRHLYEVGPSERIKSLDPTWPIRSAQALYDMLLPSLKGKICDQWDYCAKRHRPDLQDTVTLVAAIADVISSVCGAIPVVLIAVILVKKGLNRLCRCSDAKIEVSSI